MNRLRPRAWASIVAAGLPAWRAIAVEATRSRPAALGADLTIRPAVFIAISAASRAPEGAWR
jgi:hypothetical protein